MRPSGEQSEERVTLWRLAQFPNGVWHSGEPQGYSPLVEIERREFVSSPESGQHYAPGVAADLGHPEADDPPPESEDGEALAVEAQHATREDGLSEGGKSRAAEVRDSLSHSPLAESDNEARWRSYDPEGFAKAHPAESDSTPERCPTCGSDDPKVCEYTQAGMADVGLGVHHHWHDPDECCPDPWHSRSQAGEG